MDFSYLNKHAYNNIPLLDETNMGPDKGKYGFYIRKYKPSEEIKSLHTHKYIQINYVKKGSGYHLINNKKIDIYYGDIFIIPPYVPHSIMSNDNDSLEIFEFEFDTNFIQFNTNNKDNESYMDFAYLEPFMLVEEEVKPRFNLKASLQAEVENILNEVLMEYEEKISGFTLVSKALLLKLLVLTGRAYSGAIKGTETEKILNKYKKIISKSVEYIKQNYHKNINLNDVSAAVNYSRSHFSFLFKTVMGQTFVEYLNSTRIEKAIELIENTEMNIIDISYAVGFNTITNFNKNFKYYTGTTPKNFKSKTQNKKLWQKFIFVTVFFYT